MKYDVIALGEILIDFAQKEEIQKPTFQALAGGAPANVLAMLARFEKKVAMIGSVGNDQFGKFLINQLQENGIDTDLVQQKQMYPTTLAFIHNLANGERDFTFYRKESADIKLEWNDAIKKALKDTKIFHFGTLSLSDDPSKKTTINALKAVPKQCLISFDPNLRFNLWESEKKLKHAFMQGLEVADIVKLSMEELQFLTGQEELDPAIEAFYSIVNPQLLLITDGAQGSYAFTEDANQYQPAFVLGDTIDTTGAGDCFMGCVLEYVLRYGTKMSEDILEEMLRFANAASYLVTTKKGAIENMPPVEKVNEILKRK